MCVTSVVFDYYRTNVPVTYWTAPVYNDFQQVLKKLEELDEKLGQKDCHDPAKGAWMREVEERLKALEG